ncbi:MAG: hypothetical protein ABW195_13475 [Ilumatobacteraceae bacterium]
MMAVSSCGGDDDDGADVTTPVTAAETATSAADSGADTVTDASAGGAAVGDEQAYADAFSESLLQDGDDVDITQEQADCIGAEFVDVIGVERLQETGVAPADVASGNDLDFSELGLDEDDGNDLYDAFGSCDVDLRETLVAALASDDSMTEETRQCLEDGFTDDVVREFVVSAMVEGDAGSTSFNEIASACLTPVTGSSTVGS